MSRAVPFPHNRPPTDCRLPPSRQQQQALETELAGAAAATEEHDEHTRVLAEHLDSVCLEIRSTQGRLGAREREAAGEAHLRELATREGGRLRRDTARLAARRHELAKRAAGMETEAFKAGERLDQFRLVMCWNQVG